MRKEARMISNKNGKGRSGSLRRGILGTVLIGALCLAVPCGSALAEYRGFPDLDESHWAVSSGIVDWSQEHDAINGFPDGAWAPDATIDRAQAAQIIWNFAGKQVPAETTGQFNDVSGSDWFATAALWCREQGIFEGIGGTNNFSPYEPITREQVAKVLCVYAGEMNAPSDKPSAGGAIDPDRPPFSDAGDVSGWAGGVVQWAVSKGVINGRLQPDGTNLLAPQGSCT